MKASRFDNIFESRSKKGVRLYTKSLYPSFRGFEETVVRQGPDTFREVEAKRSKLFAGVAKGASQIGIRKGSSVLYLGASHGYTPSFVSDVVGKDGFVLCIDVAPRVLRDLVFVCERRENMAPLLADCNRPETYEDFVPVHGVDVVFQDIAQRNQVDIFLKNCSKYLKQGGFGLLALKARSVDVTRKPVDIFRESFRMLEQAKGFVVVDKRELAPLEKDHILFVVKKK